MTECYLPVYMNSTLILYYYYNIHMYAYISCVNSYLRLFML